MSRPSAGVGPSAHRAETPDWNSAKAGELAEHFAEYILVRGERVEARAPTYRGLQKCFLG